MSSSSGNKSSTKKAELSPEAKKAARLAEQASNDVLWRDQPESKLEEGFSPFSASAGAVEVADRLLQEEDTRATWSNRTIILTGVGPDGIGAETAKALSHLPQVTLVLAVRNTKNAEPVREAVLAWEGCRAKSIVIEPLDNMKLSSVRAFVARWNNKLLHALILNAGIMATPFQLTEDGYESQLQTNHLSHFLLATLLVPALQKGADRDFTPRVISVASLAHKSSPINWTDLNFTQHIKQAGGDVKKFPKWKAYQQSKTANILFAREFMRRYPGIVSHSLHPGIIMTRLQRDLPKEEMQRLGWIDPKTGQLKSYFKSIEQGAATTVYATLAPELASVSFSVYCEDVAPCKGISSHPLRGIAKHIFLDQNGQAAQKLWDISEQMTTAKAKL